MYSHCSFCATSTLLFWGLSGLCALQGRNVLSTELMGRGLVYSFNYDFAIRSQSSLGFGYSHVSGKIFSRFLKADAEANLFPIYFNAYGSGQRSRAFATSGVSLVGLRVASTLDIGLGEGFLSLLKIGRADAELLLGVPQIGLGFEHRNPQGVLFRITAYGIYLGRLMPWMGASLGSHF